MSSRQKDISPKVSVIIPVYNCEEFLQRCLDSIYNQTFTDFEVITIDDGSQDSSLEILEKNAKEHPEIKVISQTNHGQGYARNRAIDIARGEYILFVDSDDYIEPLTLELTVNRAEDDQSDVVHFDWKFSSLLASRPGAYLYLNREPFAHKPLLRGEECDELLQLWHFFTVNNIYRKSFLDKHNIRYGEGYLYEDVIFIVLVANRANLISILPSPLYVVQRNATSSTRSGFYDDRHYKSFIRAIEDSIAALSPRTDFTSYYLAKYFQTKFIFYYIKRTPRHLRRFFLERYVDLMGSMDIKVPDDGLPEKIMRLCLSHNIFIDKRYSLFHSLIMYKTVILPKRDRAIIFIKSAKQAIRARSSLYKKEFKKPIFKNSILFLGFDYRYTGNSRYLFEQLINDERFKDRRIRFITDDDLVDKKYRISENSDEYYRWIARAEIVIAESWIPGRIEKRNEAIFIQLWHGTPFKKMLFDSNETELVKMNSKYKVGKHWNIMRWDYLIADSREGLRKFNSAFLFPKKRIIQTGYPRVEYLINNKQNKKLKSSIKDKLGFDDELKSKKIVLYAPTWRDYNYKQTDDKQDFNYLVNLKRLADVLGDQYLVLYRDHHFLSTIQTKMHKRCIDVSSNEVQEILLITDHLVTDYSSIMFDAFAIDTPVTLFVNDLEKYQSSRGVYKNEWKDLEGIVVDNEDDLLDGITSGNASIQKGKLAKYIYDKRTSLVDFIYNLELTRINRNW